MLAKYWTKRSYIVQRISNKCRCFSLLIFSVCFSLERYLVVFAQSFSLALYNCRDSRESGRDSDGDAETSIHTEQVTRKERSSYTLHLQQIYPV